MSLKSCFPKYKSHIIFKRFVIFNCKKAQLLINGFKYDTLKVTSTLFLPYLMMLNALLTYQDVQWKWEIMNMIKNPFSCTLKSSNHAKHGVNQYIQNIGRTCN